MQLDKFIEALKMDRIERGYRNDIRVVGSYLDKERFWLVLAFSEMLGSPKVEDIIGLVYKVYPGFDIDWKSSYGVKNGTIYLALKPYIEKIALKDPADIPVGFKACGGGIYSLREANGETSYWLFVKEGDKYYLVRKDGSKPPEVVTPVESKQAKQGLTIGALVKVLGNQIGILKGVDNGAYIVKLLGQTKEVKVHDVAEFDITKEKELLREYYLNLYPPEFVDALLADYA